MNYIQWNNALIDYFFNAEKEGQEVILYFSEEVLKEIGEDKFPDVECDYVADYISALRCGIAGIPREDYLNRIILLDTKYKNGFRGIDEYRICYPPYFAYLLSFMLPFTSGDFHEFRLNNFYDVASAYFTSKRLTPDERSFNRYIRNKLQRIDYLWDELFNWLFESQNLSLGYIERIDDPAPNRRYVSKFEYHILLRREQENKLTTVFDENDVLPHEPIDRVRMIRLLIDNSQYLHLSRNAIDSIRNNDYIGEKLLARAMNFFHSWDGSNRISETEEGAIPRRGYSRARIVLCLDYNIITRSISLKHYRLYSENGIPQDSRLAIAGNAGSYQVEQSALHPYFSGPFSPFESVSFNEDFIMTDSINRIKYSHQRKDLYIFKNEQLLREWVEIPRIEYNANTTLVIARSDFYDAEMKNWFDQIPNNNKKIVLLNIAAGGSWLLLAIKQVTKYAHPTIAALQTDTQSARSINFDRQFYYGGSFYKGVLPRVWAENFELEEGMPIVATFDDGTDISLVRNDDSLYFYFPNEFPMGTRFKFKCGDVVSHNYYIVRDFVSKAANDGINQIQKRRNLIGAVQKYLTTDYIQGLGHCYSTEMLNKLRPLQDLLESYSPVFKGTSNANSIIHHPCYDTNNIGNLLVNYLSVKGRLNKSEFTESASVLLQRYPEIEDPKKLINSVLYDLQDLGHIDYDASEGQICINRATVVITPSPSGTTIMLVGARDNKFIKDIIDYSGTGTYSVDVRTNDLLLPQTVFIKFKSVSHDPVISFAKKFGLIFRCRNDIYTQFALANALDLKDWKQYVIKASCSEVASDFEGGELFDILSLRYVPKPSDFDRNISLIRFRKINGFKKAYRLWYEGEAYIITEGHYGVYLFLYLYAEREKAKLKDDYSCHYINRFQYDEGVMAMTSLTNVLVYNNEKQWLGVPVTCPLPKYYATAFTLLSGEMPVLKRHEGKLYKVYKNVKSLFCRNSLNGLHQSFIGNNQSNLIFANE